MPVLASGRIHPKPPLIFQKPLYLYKEALLTSPCKGGGKDLWYHFQIDPIFSLTLEKKVLR
ncbi:MAG: hypothetical protein KKD29_08295, partial [Candidatus Omnitrophica bacterium]|nr:hypothetical protein [Candidatus Omnitrophota bacterium]